MTIEYHNDHQRLASVAALYDIAKKAVLRLGFGGELAWQKSLDILTVTESDFLREAAWVVLCSGFRESIVRRTFPQFSLCFLEWESAQLIVDYKDHCRAAALSCFANSRKVDAIIRIAYEIAMDGFASFRASVLANPVDSLQRLPQIGTVTARHLAKNLGVAIAKPDRHLERLASLAGYPTVDALCQDIAELSGDSVQVVDVVLWRYSERLASASVYA